MCVYIYICIHIYICIVSYAQNILKAYKNLYGTTYVTEHWQSEFMNIRRCNEYVQGSDMEYSIVFLCHLFFIHLSMVGYLEGSLKRAHKKIQWLLTITDSNVDFRLRVIVKNDKVFKQQEMLS